MTDYFYRYRPIERVVDGNHGLKNQGIYFSATDEFNDPMEGYKDIFWLGDKIVWRNLLKHWPCKPPPLYCLASPVRSGHSRKYRI